MKDIGESVQSIKENLVPKKDFEATKEKLDNHILTGCNPDDIDEVKEDIIEMKKRITWKDVFNAVIEAIEKRVTRLEELANGRLKG